MEPWTSVSAEIRLDVNSYTQLPKSHLRLQLLQLSLFYAPKWSKKSKATYRRGNREADRFLAKATALLYDLYLVDDQVAALWWSVELDVVQRRGASGGGHHIAQRYGVGRSAWPRVAQGVPPSIGRAQDASAGKYDGRRQAASPK